MAEARVENIDAIKAFKRALWKFAEAANTALGEGESDAASTLRWLETEQRMYWQSNVRKAGEAVTRAAEALREKRIFKDASGRTPSAVDEEKALAKARRMKELAEEKLENVRRSVPRLQREIMMYKGQVQRLGTFVASDIPVAAAKLDKIVSTLEAYIGLQAGDTVGSQASISQPTAGISTNPADDQPISEAASPAPAPADEKAEDSSSAAPKEP